MWHCCYQETNDDKNILKMEKKKMEVVLELPGLHLGGLLLEFSFKHPLALPAS